MKSTAILLIIFLATNGFSQLKFEKITLLEALAKAKKEHKKVFVDVYTQWCGPCKFMDKNVFNDTEIGTRMEKNYVSIKVDYDNNPDKLNISKYGIKGYPTMLFLDTLGNEIARIYGSETKERFIKFLDRQLPAEQRPENIAIKKMKDNPNDKEIWKEGLSVIQKHDYSKLGSFCEVYFSKFGLNALNDEMDKTIFYTITLPLSNPIIQEILNDSSQYGNWNYTKYKILEWAEEVKTANSDAINTKVKKEIVSYYQFLFDASGGDISDLSYYMNQVFPKTKPEDKGPNKDFKTNEKEGS